MRYFIFLLLFFLQSSLFSQNYNWVVPPTFELVGEFSDGFMAAKTNGRWGFVNAQGNWKVPPIYNNVQSFKDGYSVATDTLQKQWLLNKQGVKLSVDNLNLGHIQCVSDNIITAVDKSSKKCWLKKEGNKIIAFQVIDVTEVLPFTNGVAPAKKDGRWGFVDTTGNWVIAPKYQSAQPFSDGLSLVQNSTYNYGFIDRQGEYVIPPTYYYAMSFSEGLAAVEEIKEEGFGFINRKGKYEVPLTIWNVDAGFKNGIATASFFAGTTYYYFINRKGALINDNIIMPEQSNGYQYSRGITFLVTNNKYSRAVINNSGNYLIKFGSFEDMANSDTCIYPVKQDGKWGMITVLNSKPLESIAVTEFEYDNKELANAFALIGAKNMEQHKYKESEIYFSKALLMKPKDASLHMARSICRVVLKKWKSANEDLVVATSLDPNNPEIPGLKSMFTNNISEDVTSVDFATQMKAAEDNKDYKKAISIATEAINSLAPVSFIYSFRARMYYAINEQELAEKDIEDAANLNPLDDDVVKYYEAIKRRMALNGIEKAQQSNLEARKKEFDAIISYSKKAVCWSCMGNGTRKVVTGYTTKTSSEDVWTAQKKTVNTSTGHIHTDYGFAKQSVTTQVPNYKTLPCDKCNGKGTDGIHIPRVIRLQYADVIKAYYPNY